MARVVVTAETRTWETRPADPHDSWDYGDTAGEVSNVVAFVESAEVNYYGSSHGKDLGDVSVGDTVYAVVADYESGCTFGRDGGHADVLDVFTDREEAKALVTAALTPDKEKSFGYPFEHNGQTYRRAWVGYFECLNSLDIWECRIKGSAKDPWSDDPDAGYKVGR